MEKIKVAIIGTGFIGPVHIEALRRNDIEVAGLLDANLELTQKKAAELGIPKAYASIEELAADTQIVAVHVATPNHLHYEHVKAAVLAGKHVICEKPLAMDTAQGEELVALAKEKGVLNAVNFNLRFYPLSQEAKSRVQGGSLGDVFVVHGSYLQDWLLYETDWNWRLQPEFSGNMRAIADVGSHWLDLTTFITGKKIESVFADFKTFHPIRQKPKKAVETYTGKLETAIETEPQPINTEDYATVLIRYSDGSRGALTVSQVSAGRKNRLSYEIDGSKSSLAWNSESPNELWIGERSAPNQILLKDPSLLSPEAAAISSYPGGHNEGFPDTLKQLQKKFYAHVRAGVVPEKPDYPTFADGLYMLKVGDAIFASAHSDKWVNL